MLYLVDECKLSRLRDQLSDITGIRVPGHETYGFHISLAYVIGWLTPAESIDYKTCYAQIRDVLAKLSPVIELGPPEFCVFEDMLHFSPQLYLAGDLRLEPRLKTSTPNHINQS